MLFQMHEDTVSWGSDGREGVQPDPKDLHSLMEIAP